MLTRLRMPVEVDMPSLTAGKAVFHLSADETAAAGDVAGGGQGGAWVGRAGAADERGTSAVWRDRNA